VETKAASRHHETEVVVSATSLPQQIEGDVLLGVLGAGEWLRLSDMEERYEATRSEVRAAFTRLAAQRVLDHVPNRGYRVMTVNEEELVHRVEIRLLLELPLAALLVEQANAADHAALLHLARRFEAAIESATVPALDAANHQFHRALVQLCGNPELERLVNELRERTKPRGWQHWKTVSHSRESAGDHLAMVDAMTRGDAAELRRITKRHILRLGPQPRAAFLQTLP